MGRLAAVGRRPHAAVLGDRAQPVDDPPHGQERAEPQQVDEPDAGEHTRGGEHDLGCQDRTHGAPRLGVVGAQAVQHRAHQLPAGAAGGVAHELAPERGAGDRVVRVERDVGLVGAELGAVMGHVAAAVVVGAGEGGEPEQPATGPVVRRLVAEQHPVRRLVHQRGVLRVGAAEEHEHGDPRQRSQPCRRQCVGGQVGDDHDADRLRPEHNHSQGVAPRGDVT